MEVSFGNKQTNIENNFVRFKNWRNWHQIFTSVYSTVLILVVVKSMPCPAPVNMNTVIFSQLIIFYMHGA